MLADIFNFVLVYCIALQVEQHVTTIGEMQESFPGIDQAGC
jgi:hypothetical protein